MQKRKLKVSRKNKIFKEKYDKIIKSLNENDKCKNVRK